jgi:hypothetical protein
LGISLIRKIIPNFKAEVTGGTISARYCYSVFMRHLIHLYKNGMKTIPLRIAEFGPGDSLGIGYCWLLAGANEYYAFDIVEHATKERNLIILNGLVALFKEKTRIPDNNEFSRIKPLLDDYSFPNYIFDDNNLQKNLSIERIKSIEILVSKLSEPLDKNITIKYIVPWENYTGNYPEVDFIYSQAVLEHIGNLPRFYNVMMQILIDGAFVSHSIDFKSHGETYEWNGHWAISDKKWKKIRGDRPYLINREPLSTHLHMFKKNGFTIIAKENSFGTDASRPSIHKNKLQDKFINMTEEDFNTASCFIIAKKMQSRKNGI